MDNRDIRTLKILEEIEMNQAPSQRYLSDKLNISLGLVNSFLKRLGQKGYFKATTIPRNKVKYILTPKGALEKSRLTYAYVQHSFKFYRDARKKLRDTFFELENSGVKKIVFYGAGDLAEIAYLSLQETSIKLVGIVDEKHHHKPFFQLRIRSLKMLAGMKFDKIVITKLGPDGVLHDKIITSGVAKGKIIADIAPRIQHDRATHV